MGRSRSSSRMVLAAWLAAMAACSGERDSPAPRAEDGRPNIVLILADDLGYGDLGCYGATKVRTPNVDRLAAEGIRFTDAHSPAAVCTPSRYALLTGCEFWHRRKTWHGGSLLQEVELTLPSLLKSAGYATACIGKWDLGFGVEAPDWNGELAPGPLEAGFDSYFGTPNTHSEPPYVFVADHRVVGLSPSDPIEMLPPELPDFPFGVMRGGAAAHFRELGWKNSDYAEDGTRKPDAPPRQLYDLAHDPNEHVNLYREQPAIVARLTALLASLRKAGRTRSLADD